MRPKNVGFNQRGNNQIKNRKGCVCLFLWSNEMTLEELINRYSLIHLVKELAIRLTKEELIEELTEEEIAISNAINEFNITKEETTNDEKFSKKT
jgi:parvulin-like peptidyl-prolyl isomerase